MFERIDKEEDGEVYVREVVEFLRVLDDNMEQNNEVIWKSLDTMCDDFFLKQVNNLFKHYKRDENRALDFKEFAVNQQRYGIQFSASTFEGDHG